MYLHQPLSSEVGMEAAPKRDLLRIAQGQQNAIGAISQPGGATIGSANTSTHIPNMPLGTLGTLGGTSVPMHEYQRLAVEIARLKDENAHLRKQLDLLSPAVPTPTPTTEIEDFSQWPDDLDASLPQPTATPSPAPFGASLTARFATPSTVTLTTSRPEAQPAPAAPSSSALSAPSPATPT